MGFGGKQDIRELVYERYATVHKSDWLDASAKPFGSWERDVLHRLRGWLPENKEARGLDLGCGHGDLLATLRTAGYSNLKGLDLSPEAVRIAQERGLDVHLGDVMEFLRDTSERFELILAFDLLEHFRKDELLEVLRLIANALQPGGILIYQTPNGLSPWASHYRYGDLTHELILTPASAQTALRMTGFRDIQIREAAPSIRGPKSGLRWAIWKILWGCCAIWNLAETGSTCGGIYTRNMLVSATRAGSLPL